MAKVINSAYQGTPYSRFTAPNRILSDTYVTLLRDQTQLWSREGARVACWGPKPTLAGWTHLYNVTTSSYEVLGLGNKEQIGALVTLDHDLGDDTLRLQVRVYGKDCVVRPQLLRVSDSATLDFAIINCSSTVGWFEGELTITSLEGDLGPLNEPLYLFFEINSPISDGYVYQIEVFEKILIAGEEALLPNDVEEAWTPPSGGPPAGSLYYWAPGTALWQDDARSVSANTTADPIAVADNATGGSDRLTQTNATYRPFLGSSGQISCSSDFLQCDALTASMGTGYTIGLSFTHTSGDTLVSLHDGAGANRGMIWVSGAKLRYYYSTGSSSVYGTATVSTGVRYTLIWTNDMSGNANIYLDGVLDVTLGVATALSIGQLSFGQEWDGGSPSNFWTGDYHRIAVYGSVLSAPAIAALHTWLAS